MNRDTGDDPRLVLAILNSLGVIGVTASELKAFMKALKIYRKEKERYNEQWKEETKIKLLLQQGYFKNRLINFNKENTKENGASMSEKKFRHQTKPMESDHLIENKQQDFYNKQSSNFEPKYDETENLKNDKKPKHRIKPIQSNFTKEILKESHLAVHKENDAEKKMDTLKIVQNSKREPSMEKIEMHREPSAKSHKSIASSVISSNKSCRQSGRLRSSKKIGSDPVTLYNEYKRYWSKLSFPGEEPHAKLRWAVREKMLGSEPNPRPR